MTTTPMVREQTLTNSQKSLPNTIESKQEISLYGEGKVTSKILADCFISLKNSFPKLPAGWYKVLQQMINEEKFTDQRLIDATKNLIKSSIYPEPTIAQMLSYDKRIKVYTYDQLLKESTEYSTESRRKFLSEYEMVIINKQKRYVLKEFANQFERAEK